MAAAFPITLCQVGIKTQCLHFQKLAKLPNIHIRVGAGSNNFKTLNLLILAIIRVNKLNVFVCLYFSLLGLLLREKKEGKGTFSKIKKIKNRISQSFGKLGEYEASINISRIQVSIFIYFYLKILCSPESRWLPRLLLPRLHHEAGERLRDAALEAGQAQVPRIQRRVPGQDDRAQRESS